MKKYENMDNFGERTHTIQVTLQMGEYKGNIAYNVGGNCFGADLLEAPFEYDTQKEIDRYVLNDCELKWNDEYKCYEAVLKNEEGDEMIIDDWDEEDIKNCVVGLNIIDCVVEGKSA